jgi:sensor histidine kinase regulating citrate/malate metabolism
MIAMPRRQSVSRIILILVFIIFFTLLMTLFTQCSSLKEYSKSMVTENAVSVTSEGIIERMPIKQTPHPTSSTADAIDSDPK